MAVSSGKTRAGKARVGKKWAGEKRDENAKTGLHPGEGRPVAKKEKARCSRRSAL
jgi:hypothetical protein